MLQEEIVAASEAHKAFYEEVVADASDPDVVKDHYILREWFEAFAVDSTAVGPIDNSSLVCAHGAFRCARARARVCVCVCVCMLTCVSIGRCLVAIPHLPVFVFPFVSALIYRAMLLLAA